MFERLIQRYTITLNNKVIQTMLSLLFLVSIVSVVIIWKEHANSLHIDTHLQ